MLVTTGPSPSTIEETAVITTEIMKTGNDRKDEGWNLLHSLLNYLQAEAQYASKKCFFNNQYIERSILHLLRCSRRFVICYEIIFPPPGPSTGLMLRHSLRFRGEWGLAKVLLNTRVCQSAFEVDRNEMRLLSWSRSRHLAEVWKTAAVAMPNILHEHEVLWFRSWTPSRIFSFFAAPDPE